jgi:hypothetical protein
VVVVIASGAVTAPAATDQPTALRASSPPSRRRGQHEDFPNPWRASTKFPSVIARTDRVYRKEIKKL